MKSVKQTSKFKKQYKACIKRGYDLSKFLTVLNLLRNDEPLPVRCRPHKLSGNYSDKWECHIEPDWLLIYEFDDDFIYLLGTGTHSDLFR